jgi:hypothetical protein
MKAMTRSRQSFCRSDIEKSMTFLSLTLRDHISGAETAPCLSRRGRRATENAKARRFAGERLDDPHD